MLNYLEEAAFGVSKSVLDEAKSYYTQGYPYKQVSLSQLFANTSSTSSLDGNDQNRKKDCRRYVTLLY